MVDSDPHMLARWRHQLGEFVRIRWNTQSGECRSFEGMDDLDDRFLFSMHNALANRQYSVCPQRQQLVRDLLPSLLKCAVAALQMFNPLICVENFREIRTVPGAESDGEAFNGYNVIARLREMQHPKIGNEDEQATFDRVQEFVRDLLAEPELLMEVPTSEDAIYISMHDQRLPLESYGSGLHQLVILCAALAMHDDHVVCIEEPEIHMHPELQRKFLRFIADETTNHYFITTHSNVFLDFLPNVAVYHVAHDGTKSTVTHVEATAGVRNVLTDLGYKASDLLQTNCVIWVEGPSDRVYLNRWLNLTAPELVEGIHYAIIFYGGKLLAHFAAADDSVDDRVNVLRINRHAIFMMDRDAVKPNDKLNATKERIQEETGVDQCWVTQGREIENYLRPELLSEHFSDKCGQSVTVKFNRTHRVEKAIVTATKGVEGPKSDYAGAKVQYARMFCERMTEADLDVLDLRERLNRIVAFIHRVFPVSVHDPI